MAFVTVKIGVAAWSSSKFTSVYRKEAVVMFRYLISNGLKFQLDFICLGFAPHDRLLSCGFGLKSAERNLPTRGGRGGGICYSSGRGQQLNPVL